jgi:hypothetical protein
LIEFTAWPKIARLFREVVVTEKIDGTNAAVGVQEFPFGWHAGGTDSEGVCRDVPANATLVFGLDGEDGLPDTEYLVYAQSRSRVITPTMDNHGFAKWAWDNAEALANILGPGVHFGEWWGSGIQRGYGLANGEKRFSLFNVHRWGNDANFQIDGQCNYLPPGLDIVPVLYRGPFHTEFINDALAKLRLDGSQAAPGFGNPEGIIVYHTAGRMMFKATLQDDEAPKAVTAQKLLATAA